MQNDIWVEVSKDALISNYRQIKNYISDQTKLCCVLKANAYSHNLVTAAKILSEEKADYFGLTHIDEALKVRNAGIKTPILLFMPVSKNRIKEAVENNIDMTCASIYDAECINDTAAKLKRKANIHLKLETGMGRLGILQSEINEVLAYIKECPYLNVVGTYTHFSNSGSSNVRSINSQFNSFRRITSLLQKRQYNLGMLHCANSAAALRFPNMHLDMVRCGTVLFGQYPSAYARIPEIKLENTWTLKARVVAVRTLPVGSTVGYGSEYTTVKNTKTAVISCGFSHGWTMIPESVTYRMDIIKYLFKKYTKKHYVKINNYEYPIIGRISMQMSVADITDAKEEIKVNDEVIIPTMRIPISSDIPRIIV